MVRKKLNMNGEWVTTEQCVISFPLFAGIPQASEEQVDAAINPAIYNNQEMVPI